MSIKGHDIISLATGGVLEWQAEPIAPVVSGNPTKLDIKMRAKVVSVLNKLGKILTFWIYPAGSYDPATGDYTSGDAQQYNMKAIPPYAFEIKYIDGDVVRLGDLQTGIAAKNIEFTPQPGIKVTINSELWAVLRVAPIYSGEQVAMYMLHLRK